MLPHLSTKSWQARLVDTTRKMGNPPIKEIPLWPASAKWWIPVLTNFNDFLNKDELKIQVFEKYCLQLSYA
jgi:hypothetical protein